MDEETPVTVVGADLSRNAAIGAPPLPIRVMVVDGVGPFGGASRSLYEALRAMPAGTVQPYFVVQAGTVVKYYGELAAGLITTPGLTRFDNTRYSHYRGVRWFVVGRELFHLPFTIVALLRAKSRWRSVDVIHANEVTEIVPLLIAKRIFGAPAVVHVRSLARIEERSRRYRWLMRRLRRDIDAVVAIDQNVRETLPADIPVDVIHNSFTPACESTPDTKIAARLAALRPSSLKVGFVGNIHRSKGLFDMLEAARLVREAGRDVEFVVVGGATRPVRGFKAWLLRRAGLQQDVQGELAARIAGNRLTDSFHLLGATSDIQRVYDAIDVLCFPSHFDAPGRPVFEAAFSSVPSIVAVRNPQPDTLIDGETGLAVPGQDPQRLAEAILRFADHRGEVERMGRNARRLAEANFHPRTNAEKLLAVYDRVVRRCGRLATAAADTSEQSASRPSR